MHVETLAWSGGLPGRLRVLDQTRLPLETVHLELGELEELRAAICSLAVRGAPALGVLAGYGVVLGVQQSSSLPAAELLERVRASAARLSSARPTAVNLAWGAQRVLRRAEREQQ